MGSFTLRGAIWYAIKRYINVDKYFIPGLVFDMQIVIFIGIKSEWVAL
jgi:hypothetical protein